MSSMSAASTPDIHRKSREQLLSPCLKTKTDQVLVEVSYQGSRNTRAKTRMKPLKSGPQPGTVRANCISSGTGSDVDSNGMASLQYERHLLKNMIILGLSFVFVFSAFNALQNLQSSLFTETGLGLQALACVYGCMAFSCFYGPAFAQKHTPNWTIVLSFVMFALFVSTFFYPRLYTVIPSAILLGLMMGPLFSAQTTFLMLLVSKLTGVTDGIRDKINQRFLRIFYLFFNSGRIWGNVITALLLHYGGEIDIYATYRPHSQYPIPYADEQSPVLQRVLPSPSLCIEQQCKAGSIWTNHSAGFFVFNLPSNVSLMIIAVYLGLILFGVAMVTALLDKFEMYVYQDPLERSLLRRTSRDMIYSLVDPQFRLMIPMVLFIGLGQGFIVADFTRSYVSCAVGLEAVGYTMMCLGTMNTLGSLAVHQFSKHIKRPIIMAAGLIFHAGLLMVLWLWRPVRDDIAVFYVITAGWGLCNSVWETLTVSYMASTFSENWQAPFSTYYMLQAIGLSISFGYSFHLCTEIKLLSLTVVLLIASVPYAMLEFRFHQQQILHQSTSML